MSKNIRKKKKPVTMFCWFMLSCKSSCIFMRCLCRDHTHQHRQYIYPTASYTGRWQDTHTPPPQHHVTLRRRYFFLEIRQEGKGCSVTCCSIGSEKRKRAGPMGGREGSLLNQNTKISGAPPPGCIKIFHARPSLLILFLPTCQSINQYWGPQSPLRE